MQLPDRPTILETTLRDGSYVVNFSFTADDTRLLARSLEACGVRLIEVGHGLGINAGGGKAGASDAEYIAAAREGAPGAAIGMFCIPGIATLDHLRACADAGLHFVRIGANVDQTETSREFIELARRLGMFVCTNFMKSYVLSPAKFGDICALSADYGSQMLYLVDSAGGMLPRDIKVYVEEMRGRTGLPVGFHGHNNLHLAVANSLAALDAGALVVDTTLLGMGRSSGNAATEVMVPLMQREYGACREMDGLTLLELGERLISPLVRYRWEDTEKTALGLAQVHSMYADRIRDAARTEGRSFASVVQEVGLRDRLRLSDGVLESALEAARPRDFLEPLVGDGSLLGTLGSDVGIDHLINAHHKTGLPVSVSVEAGAVPSISLRPGALSVRLGSAQELEALRRALPETAFAEVRP